MRRSCALLLVAAALFITGCEQEGAEISPAELAATIRFDGEATLSRIKTVVGELHRGTAGDCEQVTKEVSGFRERGTKAIGTFHHVRPHRLLSHTRIHRQIQRKHDLLGLFRADEEPRAWMLSC